MDAKEFDRLVLCMQLTTSDNDNEALSAVRRANAILARHKTRWDELLPKIKLNGAPKSPNYQHFDEGPSPSGIDQEELEWLQALFARALHAQCINSKSAQFLQDQAARLARYGHSMRISEKQWQWLENIDSILSDHEL